MIVVWQGSLAEVLPEWLSPCPACMGCMPSASILWPKYSRLGRRKEHLARLRCNPTACSRLRTSSRIFRCSSGEVLEIRISLM